MSVNEAGSPPPDAPATLLAEVEARLRLSDTREVETKLRRVLDDGDVAPRTRAGAMSACALLDFFESRFDSALRSAREAVRLWYALDDLGQAATVRATGARALLAAGLAEDAIAEGTIALEDAQRAGDPRALMKATSALGHLQYGIGMYDQALIYFERAERMARTLDDLIAEGDMLDAMACAVGSMTLAPQAVDPHEARRLLTEAIALWERARRAARLGGDRRLEGSAVVNHAEALLQLERGSEALTLLRSHVPDPERDQPLLIWHHADIEGVICLRLGRHDEAVALLEAALRHADRNGHAAITCEHLSEAFEASGDLASALRHYKRFHELSTKAASESAQRSARVATIRLETIEAQAQALEQRRRAERLETHNDQLSRRADDMKRLSLEDPLTGLANRRMMDMLIAADPQCFAVAMMDVDHFKRINDDWSHVVGDDVLRRLASLMRGCCRSTDTPVRYGGEEFAILLRRLNEADVVAMAERIRHTIEAFDWATIATGLKVTVSIGIACGYEADSTAGVMALADRRLYAAKKAGRNRVFERRDTVPPIVEPRSS